MRETKIETKQQNQEKQKEKLSIYSNISLKYTNNTSRTTKLPDSLRFL